MTYKNNLRIEQAKTLLFSFRDAMRRKSYVLVNILFLMVSYCFFAYSPYLAWVTLPKNIETILNINFKFWDTSFCCLMFMFSLSKRWGVITWIAYVSLCLIWIINFAYISFELEVDLYFAAFYFILGCNYIAASVWKLTNN